MNSFFFDTLFPIVFSIIFLSIFCTVIAGFITTAKQAKQVRQKINRQYPQYPAEKHEGIHNDSFSHKNQLDYSESYSANNSAKDSGIKDKPLSEAERNVLYGK